MTARRFAIAALAIVLHCALMASLLVSDAEDPWWLAVQVAATALALVVIAWAYGWLLAGGEWPDSSTGTTRLDPTDSPRRMSTPMSTAPRPRTHAEANTAPTPTRRTGRPPISDIAPGEKTPQRQVRISDEDWYGAAAKAAELGTTSSDVTRRLLRAWRLGEIDLPE